MSPNCHVDIIAITANAQWWKTGDRPKLYNSDATSDICQFLSGSHSSLQYAVPLVLPVSQKHGCVMRQHFERSFAKNPGDFLARFRTALACGFQYVRSSSLWHTVYVHSCLVSSLHTSDFIPDRNRKHIYNTVKCHCIAFVHDETK